MNREILEFSPNVPVELALAYGAGKPVDTPRGQRFMFTLANGKLMFLEPAPAQIVANLGVKANQPFYLVKNRESHRGSRVEWRAWLSPDANCGEQPDGTLVVPLEAGVSAPTLAPASAAPSRQTPPANNGHDSTGSAGKPPAPKIDIHNGWAQFLLAQTNALVDVYAAALRYSEKHSGLVIPSDVLTLLTTAWSLQCRDGGPDVA